MLQLGGALAATAGALFCFRRGLQGDAPLVVIALMTAAANAGSIAGRSRCSAIPWGARPRWPCCTGAALALVVLAAFRLAPAQARIVAEGA